MDLARVRHLADSIAIDLPSVARIVTGDDRQYERWLAGAGPAIGLPGPRADACFLQIYTSGTTGFPKGPMLTCANLTANAVALGPASLAAFLNVPDVASRDYRQVPVPVVAGYGMTECSPTISILGDREHRDAGHPRRLASAGKPIAGTEVRIADLATGAPLGPGHLTGRLEDMFITGGDNVYAAEVERVLAEHPDVAEAARWPRRSSASGPWPASRPRSRVRTARGGGSCAGRGPGTPRRSPRPPGRRRTAACAARS
jgi:acyl-CoA synthetase (AMP-forming)/AMP-acid ligase II